MPFAQSLYSRAMATLESPQSEPTSPWLQELSDRFYKMAVKERVTGLDVRVVPLLSQSGEDNFGRVKAAVAALTALCSEQQSASSLHDVIKTAASLDGFTQELLSPLLKNMTDDDHVYSSRSDVVDALRRFIGALTALQGTLPTTAELTVPSPSVTEEVQEPERALPVASELEKTNLQELPLGGTLEELVESLPPDDFRKYPAVPLASELLTSTKPFLRPNIVEGAYEDLDHYLDVQYRLLREDFVRPLREGIQRFLQAGTQPRTIDDVNVYEDVAVLSSEVTLGGITHTIAFRAADLRGTQWNKSKRFMNNSLLCLSNDGFTTIYFAVVVLRQPRHLQRGRVKVVFEDLFVETVSWDRYTMVETQIYFEAYKHNMLALQRIATDALPFYRYIVRASSDVRSPTYLQCRSSYDIGALLKPAKSNSGQEVKQTKRVEVLNESAWPDLSELDLDASQLAAVMSSLQKEFSVIQGPPGTGKTFIGLKIVQVLLTNKSVWNSDGGPILVVCYTNHALDQFLEGILRCTDEIVRLGGRCSSEILQDYTITSLRRKCLHGPKVGGIIRDIFRSCRVLRELSQKITSVYTVATQFEFLEPYMSAQVKSSFRSRPYAIKKGFHLWLDIDSLKRMFLENAQRDAATVPKDLYSSPDDGGGLYGMSFDGMDGFGVTGQLSNLDQAWCIHVHKLVSDEEKTADDTWVQDVWQLHNAHRWRLYRYWASLAIRDFQKKVDVWKGIQRAAQDDLHEAYVSRDLQYLSRAEVVGATTTGAAKSQELLKRLRPSIVIVEEAAEVLEAHVVTSLAPGTKHLILIGDHKQLRPSNAVYELAVRYKMDVSLFERMLTNGMICQQLQVQHRMRPAFAKLLVPHFYETLENHSSVELYEDIRGMDANLFFINHAYLESSVADSKSHSNEHEAEFLVELADYLLNQGYEPDQITILTTYSGQMLRLKALAGKRKCGAVRIAVVDDFQGEENEIILLSLVRSNPRGVVGFIRTPNRICVALSRAKKGFYCIGNFDMIVKSSPIWEAIMKELGRQNATGDELRLRCQGHPDTVTTVKTAEDFVNVPEGGCGVACAASLKCGHTCSLLCHGYDRLHEQYKCKEPCTRTCKHGHRCSLECSDDCKECTVMVATYFEECGHTCDVPCCEAEEGPLCSQECDRLLECGHRCALKCREPCECKTLVTAVASCGHDVTVECSLSKSRVEVQKRCGMPCERVLPCGHPCRERCNAECGTMCAERVLVKCDNGHESETLCSLSSVHVCEQPCDKQLTCGHKCQSYCGDICTIFCDMPVEATRDCGHTVQVACHEQQRSAPLSDVPCEAPVEAKCKLGHAVSTLCHLSKNAQEVTRQCDSPCRRKLSCGHACPEACGQPCPSRRFASTEAKLLKTSVPCHLQYGAAQDKHSGTAIHKFLSSGARSFEGPCHLSTARGYSTVCKEACNIKLPCGHDCVGTCGTCQVQPHSCGAPCPRTLPCGHPCKGICSDPCALCLEPCPIICAHGACPLPCGYPCLPCSLPCRWNCPHHRCRAACFEECTRKSCDIPCLRRLRCGHLCQGYCGEPCPKVCGLCRPTLYDSLVKDGSSDGNRFVRLVDCGHCVPNEKLRSLFEVDKKSSVPVKCPVCQRPITFSFRYGSYVKRYLSSLDCRKKEVLDRLAEFEKSHERTSSANAVVRGRMPVLSWSKGQTVSAAEGKRGPCRNVGTVRRVSRP